MNGLFITFEGVDGCGKSTQMRFLHEYLTEKGFTCTLTREPGGCKISEEIRTILLDVENEGMNRYTEALLYAAARVQHIDQVILPALARGEVVLCDRYLDSSIAYQGYARGIGREAVLAMNRYAVEKCLPDVTFFLDYRPQDAFLRMNPKKQMDRLENEDDDFFTSVYEGFIECWKAEPNRIRRVDVSGTKFETRDKLRGMVDEVLHAWQET